MTELKLRKVGNSLGFTLPREMVTRLRASEGDTLIATDTPSGFQITPHDEEFELAMQAFDEGRKQYRNALRELAKR